MGWRTVTGLTVLMLICVAPSVLGQTEHTTRPTAPRVSLQQNAATVPLETSPFWEVSNGSWYTTGIVFRDINRDGQIDVMLSNGNDINMAPNVAFLQSGWSLSTDPNWTSANPEYSGHCAAGDINDDGWADLVVANFLGSGRFSTPNVANLYLVSNGHLGSSPAWRSVDSCYSFSCALGDIDLDGDLDLILATGEPYNAVYETDRMYFNDNGMFAPLPDWESDYLSAALDVTVGDVDNDGDLDLAFCYDNLPTAVYYNDDGVMPTAPGWQAANSDPGNTLTLGDVNGDGWRDIVVAFNDQLGGSGTFAVYLNDGAGGFSSLPDWQSSTGGYGSAVALYDYDLDGDLDLAAGRWWDQPRIYENTSGTLSAEPVWRANPGPVVEELVWVDVDASGVEWLADTIDGDSRSLFYTSYAPWYVLDSVVADGRRLGHAEFCFDPIYGWVSLEQPPVEVAIYYQYSFTADLAVADWEGNNIILGNTHEHFVNFTADPTTGWAPLEVTFEDHTADASAWLYDFGDGDSATTASPTHRYDVGGVYTVSLAATTPVGTRTRTARNLVAVLADTVTFVPDSAFPGQTVAIPIAVANTQNVEELTIPLRLSRIPVELRPDSIRAGARTAAWPNPAIIQYQQVSDQYLMTLHLLAPPTESLPPGSGEVARLFATIDWEAPVGAHNVVDTSQGGTYQCELLSSLMSIAPKVSAGTVGTRYIMRGDINADNRLTLTDLTLLVNYLFLEGPRPMAFVAADCTADSQVTLTDLTRLLNHLFLGGPPPEPY